MQSKMGFMSTESLHYYYNLNAEYGASRHRLPCSVAAARERPCMYQNVLIKSRTITFTDCY